MPDDVLAVLVSFFLFLDLEILFRTVLVPVIWHSPGHTQITQRNIPWGQKRRTSYQELQSGCNLGSFSLTPALVRVEED